MGCGLKKLPVPDIIVRVRTHRHLRTHTDRHTRIHVVGYIRFVAAPAVAAVVKHYTVWNGETVRERKTIISRQR